MKDSRSGLALDVLALLAARAAVRTAGCRLRQLQQQQHEQGRTMEGWEADGGGGRGTG